MRIISCASYYATGSSAITNYLEEFDDCYSLTDYEFRFLYDPDGVGDLEFHLVENHHRHNSGYALKRFKRFVDELGNPYFKKYEHFFDGKWKIISNIYIDRLTEFTYTGYWHQDVIDKGLFFYIRKRCLNKFLQHTVWKNQKERALNEMPKEITYCSYPSEEKFLEYTRAYTEELFNAANRQNKTNVIVDQVVPPSNVNRYLRYFNDIKVFIVERDPRDVYLAEKYIYKGRVVPTESVELYCKWYEYTRRHRNYEHFDNEKVMFVRFEDLIYNYDTMTKNINHWLGFSDSEHIHIKERFDPKISINNTRLWEKIPGVEQDVRYIEEHLPQYLYPYSKENNGENSCGV